MRRAFVFLFAIAMLASACADNATDESTSGEPSADQGWEQFVVEVSTETELTPPAPAAGDVTAAYLMRILDPNRLLPTAQNEQAWIAETTVLTQYRARCYDEAGFPYFAVDEAFENPFAALASGVYPFSREYAETYGLVSHSSQTNVAEAAARQSAQDSYTAELSAEEQLVFVDLRLSCREATDVYSTTPHVEAALGVLASHSINITNTIVSDPRFVDFEQTWVACMSDQGFGYESLEALHQDVDVSIEAAVASYDCDGNDQWAITETIFNEVIEPLVAEHLDEIKAAIAAA